MQQILFDSCSNYYPHDGKFSLGKNEMIYFSFLWYLKIEHKSN